MYTVLSELVNVLSIPGGSLSSDQDQELAETVPCYHQMMLDGGKLAGFLKQCPPDTKDMIMANQVLEKMTELLSLFQHLSRLTAVNGPQQTEIAREASHPAEPIRRRSSGAREISVPQRTSVMPLSERTTPTQSTLTKATPTTMKSKIHVTKATSTVVESVPTSVKTVIVDGSAQLHMSNSCSQPGSADAILSSTPTASTLSGKKSEEEILRKIEMESQKVCEIHCKCQAFLVVYSL